MRDWLNQHAFKGKPNARLIYNLNNGAPLIPESPHTTMTLLKKENYEFN